MGSERVTVSQFGRKGRPLRNRKRIGLSVAPETIQKLKAMVEDGECDNVSRGIDFVTGFFCENRGAVQVVFSNPEAKAAFTRAALKAGKTPAQMLESLAIQFIGE